MRRKFEGRIREVEVVFREDLDLVGRGAGGLCVYLCVCGGGRGEGVDTELQ
jgi:hypothetical protein